MRKTYEELQEELRTEQEKIDKFVEELIGSKIIMDITDKRSRAGAKKAHLKKFNVIEYISSGKLFKLVCCKTGVVSCYSFFDLEKYYNWEFSS